MDIFSKRGLYHQNYYIPHSVLEHHIICENEIAIAKESLKYDLFLLIAEHTIFPCPLREML